MTSLEEIIKNVSDSVFTKLGSHHREYVYRRAMVCELQHKGNFVEEEVDIPILYPLGHKKLTIGIERADIIIGQCCILEIKCGNPKTATIANALGQARRYVRHYSTTGAKVAFVVFFGDSGPQIFRVTNEFSFVPEVQSKEESGAQTILPTEL